jgi:hypothetical protein
MKKLFLIFVFLLISCSTPEKKIIESFKSQRMARHTNIKIKGAEIYDTIYIRQIDKILPDIQNKVDLYEKRINNMNNYRDSVFRLGYPRPKRDSLMRKEFDRRQYYDREQEHQFHRLMIYNNLDKQIDDSICGYYARIITSRDTLNFVVAPLTFMIICPAFMFEE